MDGRFEDEVESFEKDLDIEDLEEDLKKHGNVLMINKQKYFDN